MIHNKKRANSNEAVHKPKWLAKMRPSRGYKELLNEKTLARKKVFSAILQNLNRQRFHPPSSLPKNTRVPMKVAHITYVGDIRLGEKTAAIHEIREILKAGKNTAPGADTDDAINIQQNMKFLMFTRAAVVFLAVYRRIPWVLNQTIKFKLSWIKCAPCRLRCKDLWLAIINVLQSKARMQIGSSQALTLLHTTHIFPHRWIPTALHTITQHCSTGICQQCRTKSSDLRLLMPLTCKIKAQIDRRRMLEIQINMITRFTRQKRTGRLVTAIASRHVIPCTSRRCSLRKIESRMETMVKATMSLLTSISLLLVTFGCPQLNV